MISHKYYSNPHVLIMRSNASKDSSHSFQVSSEISFLITVRKTLPISGQTVDLTSKNFHFRKTAPGHFAARAADRHSPLPIGTERM